MTAPLRFSIVTPSYNQAEYVGQTIESVLSQAGDFAIEYFVVDGGSNDASVDVIREYADRLARGDWPVRCADVRLTWVSEPDGGQAHAINKGFRQAAGDIVSWINSDDYYLPGAFQRVATAMGQRREADFIYGDGDVVDESGKVLWEWLARPFDLELMKSYHFLWNDFTNFIMQQSTFWRRSVFERIGYLDESFHFALDIELWIRAGQAGLRLEHIPERLGAFRWVQGTKSLSSPTVFWEDYLEIFRRYRGAGRLSPFLGYYYYNVARHTRADGADAGGASDAALAAAERRLFERWRQLTASETSLLHRQSVRGLTLSHLLLANDRLSARQPGAAREHCRIALAAGPIWRLHPLTLWYGLRSLAGPRAAERLSRLGQIAVGIYRRYRYDYRYRR